MNRLRLVVLTVLLAFAPFTRAQSTKPPEHRKTNYQFRVSASHWTDTGLVLEPGDRIHIYGGVLACGGPSPEEKWHLPVSSAPPGALLAKLQPEEAPIVATPDADMPIVDPSHLFLGANCAYMTGTTPVRVHVSWHKPKPQH